mmetsp:Transcript_26057/g.40417  ORF Transcript_26057/g.40417 Transcript_26057/m.40417 type:complete len:509 (+) Transcript_26057:85-1611(+)
METVDDDSYSLSDLISEIRSMKQEISDLKSRVTLLEEDLNSARKRLRKSNLDDPIEDAPTGIKNKSNSRKYKDICDFCHPLRCQTCEKRVSMIPSVISLLVESDFIGVKELGMLSCTSKLFHKFICSDSDDDIWFYLLQRNWPSTMIIPQEIRRGLPNRLWLHRMITSKCPTTVCGNEEDSHPYMQVLTQTLQECRQKIRRTLYTLEGNNGRFPPLPDPTLRANDLLVLMDMHNHDGKVIACAAVHDVEGISKFLKTSSLSFSKVIASPVEMKVGNFAHFFWPRAHLVTGKIHLVRLTDYNIICLHRIKKPTFDDAYCDDSFHEFDLEANEISLNAALLLNDSIVGNIPTAITSRIGNDSDVFQGICLRTGAIQISLPRSPYHFGYEHTVSRYMEYLNSDEDQGSKLDYDEFRCRLWDVDESNPELSVYHQQAKEIESINGKYFGTIEKQSEYVVNVAINFSDGTTSKDIDLCGGTEETSGVTFLHVLDELFWINSKQNLMGREAEVR